MTATPLLEMKGIEKVYPGVHALKGVHFSIMPGEVVALIGENGAGKSTLMKILGGTQHADTGTIAIDGTPVTIRNVSDAIRLGIGFVHQELNNLDNLDIAGNIFLGREPTWAGPLKLIDRRKMNRESATLLAQLKLRFPPQTPLIQLAIAHQQMVEIVKALSLKARIIIMDEPTSSLTLTETDRLLATIRELRDQGVSIIYISHRLDEIKQVANRVVVLRDGQNAGTLSRDEISHENMIRLMVGRDLKMLYAPPADKPGRPRLEVLGLRTKAHPAHTISFEAAAGEILGFAGLVGAGRSEMAEAVFGVTPAFAGTIRVDGKETRIHRAADGIRAGIYLVPEDRRRTGLVTLMSVRENITLPGLERWSTAGIIRGSDETKVGREQVQSLRIKTASLKTIAATLSGGNQQKIVLGKWLALDPKIMIFDEPTRGIDVGAKAEIYRLMRALADRGVAVVMISSDMEEILGVSDRVAVMHEGRISGFLNRNDFSEQRVMRLAVGQQATA